MSKPKYEIVGVKPGIIAFGSRKFDLRNLSNADAKYLIDKKCPYVKAVDRKTTG